MIFAHYILLQECFTLCSQNTAAVGKTNALYYCLYMIIPDGLIQYIPLTKTSISLELIEIFEIRKKFWNQQDMVSTRLPTGIYSCPGQTDNH